jgi:hypothetical protein
MRKNMSVILTVAMVLTALMASGQVWQAHSMISKQSSSEVNIDTNVEYSNGTINSPTEGLYLWYVWINTNNIQTIFLAFQSHIYNPPIITFLGQHYHSENDTEVFVGNTMNSMEVYNDTNGNGLPDADYSAGQSEILYEFVVNSSVSFVTTPVEKVLEAGQYHYTWGIRYQTVDGFLLTQADLPDARVMIDYMDFSYDFYIQNNVSYVKTNFGIGKILEITPDYFAGNSSVTLDNLSLSLFYGTAVVTSKPYVTLVNGNPYNSTTAPPSVQPADQGEIKIEGSKAYEFLFGQNYVLFRDSQQETHQSNSTAISSQSVADGLQSRSEWIFSNLEDTLSGLFPKISSVQRAIDLDYSVSSFLYRVCYPAWSGFRLEHDPTYVAYLGGVAVPELSPPLTFVIVAALVSSVALIAALVDVRKTSKLLRYSSKTPPPTAL